ncbi:potassium-transporting ATPase subunit KdpA [Silvanigrella aquatica]|uniref:Potassium-transporting ATPase potassium-binding subunit n=1 Tax=Silvanigrella aquatica TaxID=1915309 RepID=A0A1L4D0K5_9BACT|nr:potassium-transporting ATPase subunit KdpA [Silvanigrella aquatica]APJ03743.1 potassium-transporting ATPase subunit KdpA [Silvanigrella aquatica]
MKNQDTLYLIFFILVLLIFSFPLGMYIRKVMSGEKTFTSIFISPFENFIYKLLGVNPNENQTWQKYSIDLFLFNIFTFIVTFFLLKFQNIFPFNPQNFPAIPTDMAFNTTISFLTNTNWQAYGGESTMSYFSQMVALTPHNFLSAATGLAGCIAIIRGFTISEGKGLGNFWVDLTRATLYVLLPLSFLLALIFISQGMIQNLLPYIKIKTLEGIDQIIAQGPAASQIAIKLLGTNGGGFFNANAAHPYENPTALINFIQTLSIFLIPSALVFAFGKMASHMKHAISIWIAMLILFVIGVYTLTYYEYIGNPNFISQLHLSSSFNMEGKENRFGIFGTTLFATVTTDSSCGAVNAAHGSLTPLGGLIVLTNMLLNEVIFGGVGSGLYGMILFIILAVFIAGLMVGRTPEYLGKKIESREIKITMLPVIGIPVLILGLLAIASIAKIANISVGNPGPHGFSEMFYAFTSTTQNNGSAFGSLNANTPFWNYATSFAMFFGRFLNLIPLIAIAGYMLKKKSRSLSDNSFPVHGGIFIILLLGTILIVGSLVYLPAISLGPVLEHLQLMSHVLYPDGG